ncbi:mitochondrial carrier [Violaceomyces palustris]|uniref:Mitochondrial carrier n=1 Tax=Violaceomyces palustris TaxID=1673888 RepID=A0ACD0NZI9_9BASI|nr:mitochondrial carrier [Violaceomyces palustris]
MAPQSRGASVGSQPWDQPSALTLPPSFQSPSKQVSFLPPGQPPSVPIQTVHDESGASLKGFVGGTVSGLTKLAVGHPFDTIKVRMQCSPLGTYKGAADCFLQLARKESLLGLYKGATPPALGWAITDSVLLGSLHNYRRMFARLTGSKEDEKSLPVKYHALAGLMAGWTNSIVTTPVELIKAKLQMQTQRVEIHMPGSASTASVKKEYSGPVDCVRKIVRTNGIRGLWHALPATLLFRSSFAAMFGSYEYIQKQLASLKGTSYELTPGTITFLSGGLAAEVFWLTAFPADVIKNRMMADSLTSPKYPTIPSAFRSVWNSAGPDASLIRRVRIFYTGFLPCFLRAFPTNAAALFAFETAMKLMGAEKVSRAWSHSSFNSFLLFSLSLLLLLLFAALCTWQRWRTEGTQWGKDDIRGRFCRGRANSYLVRAFLLPFTSLQV